MRGWREKSGTDYRRLGKFGVTKRAWLAWASTLRWACSSASRVFARRANCLVLPAWSTHRVHQSCYATETLSSLRNCALPTQWDHSASWTFPSTSATDRHRPPTHGPPLRRLPRGAPLPRMCVWRAVCLCDTPLRPSTASHVRHRSQPSLTSRCPHSDTTQSRSNC